MAVARSVSVGQVVVLVEHWPEPAPPVELPIRGANRLVARAVLGMLLALAGAAGVGMIIPLWTMPTPGWWFSVLFTAVIVALVAALGLAYLGSVVQSGERVRARAEWAAAAGRVERVDGTVAARTVSTIEDGGVDRFELTVDTPVGPLRAVWERATARSPMLLQTQVPGVGAPVRAWMIRGAQADAPLVIEVRDPSVEKPLPPGA